MRGSAIGFGIVTLVGVLLALFGVIDTEYLGWHIWYDSLFGSLFCYAGILISILGILGLFGVGIAYRVRSSRGKTPPAHR